MTTAIDTTGLHAAARIHLADEIARTHGLLALAMNIKDAARRTERLEQLELYMDDLDAQAQALDDMEQVAAELGDEVAEVIVEVAEVIAPKRAVTRAMRAADRAGVALVRGAAGVGRKMEQLVPGCLMTIGHSRIWEVWETDADDVPVRGWRLTLTGSAHVGVMRRLNA